ncbi:MAG: hypothetical protein ACOX7D_01975 [Alphaproteobacteria bacterium]|jgi:hypothetical protein
MKRFTAVLIALFCLPAYAEVVPDNYWEQVEELESQVVDDSASLAEVETPVQPVIQPIVTPTTVSPRTITSRSATRAVASAPVATTTRVNTPSRAVASRNASASIRNMANPNSGTVSSRQTSTAPSVNTARYAVPLYTSNSSSATPLYNSNRIAIRPSSALGVRTASAASVGTTSSSAVDTGISMEEIAQLTDFCKAQYFSCMDNFCNVLDANQGLCSCSSNVNKYLNTENVLKSATEELQKVAMQIQYLGLTKEEVISLFTQTEAEAAMSGTQDTSALKNDLDQILKLVVDIKPSSSTGLNNAFDFDFSNLDFTFDSGLDLSSLFGTSDNISNQRGAELYKTASARCKASVLDTCKKQGVDTKLVSSSYDLAIDNKCIQYEGQLNDSITQMRRTILNAKSVLQKARLAVARNKNVYDMRGCINELDTCMQSDYVCGSDYDKCLDPTGKYIVDGEIVMNTTIGDGIIDGLDEAWDAAWTGPNGLAGFINDGLTGTLDSTNMVGFLATKIGNIDTNGMETGMCVNVLKKCQNYTFTGTGSNKTYKQDNVIVREFMAQALTKIKSRQDALIADYASTCKASVQTCLTNNGAIIGDSWMNLGYVSNSIYNACKAIAEPCAGTAIGGTAEKLIYETVCYTANNSDGISTAWSIDSSTCKCPYSTNWSAGTKTCNCPSGSVWDYDLAKCVCTTNGQNIQKNTNNTLYVCATGEEIGPESTEPDPNP